uniref:Uncharacterized protein n=1 Tax=Anguilla anguilla TaxID=7936 RepID=A0A0E9VPI8_ANGAN
MQISPLFFLFFALYIATWFEFLKFINIIVS